LAEKKLTNVTKTWAEAPIGDKKNKTGTRPPVRNQISRKYPPETETGIVGERNEGVTVTE